MRVAYVLKRYPRYSETFIVNEILAHEAAGLEVEIFALRHPADPHFQDVIAKVRAPVTYLRREDIKASTLWKALGKLAKQTPDLGATLASAWGESATEVHQAIELARLLEKRKIDHIHAHFGTSATSVARMAACFSRRSYTFTAHAKDIFHDDTDYTDLRAKMADAARVVTVSDYNVGYLRDVCPESQSNVTRVYNGIDLERFPYTAPANRPPHIVAVGRLIEKKGFEYLVDACGMLKERGVEFNCTIIGTGELAGELKQRVERRGLNELVSLVGAKPQAEVAKAVGNAAMLAAPCVMGGDGNRDGLPTVILEAMALGAPCVSTDVTGIPEVIRDGDTGLIAKQRDSKSLADAIERLLADADLQARFAANARSLIQDSFDITKNTKELREVFRESATDAALSPRVVDSVTVQSGPIGRAHGERLG
jgi:colanic acid/amylovoran biosynthesis glycosyltransferase